MKKLLLYLLFHLALQAYSQQVFQLATPMLKYESAFFKDSTSFSIQFNQPGAEVRYTLNGKEPTVNDLLYSKPVKITKQTLVKVKAFGKSFLPSATAEIEFVKDGKAIARMDFTKPHEQYSSSKKDILFDDTGGSLHFRNGTWLGYNSDTVEVLIHLQKVEQINTVLVDLLQDESSWIFLPQQIQLYYYDEQQKLFVQAADEQQLFEQQAPRRTVSKKVAVKRKVKTNKLKLVLLPVTPIPDWHAGKGNHAWLFIDEIKVY